MSAYFVIVHACFLRNAENESVFYVAAISNTNATAIDCNDIAMSNCEPPSDSGLCP
jgi:hypothetical protein